MGENTILSKLTEALIATGPGGILALLVFYYYRQDRKDSSARWGKTQEELFALARDFKEIVQENTKAIHSNTEVVRD